MRKTAAFAALASALWLCSPASAAPEKPTVVLVHGAFAGSSSWNGVVTELERDGYTVIAVANPLRGVASDGAYVAATVKSVPGPVVLVGHSYGGAVISTAAASAPNVKALVYVSAFAPDVGDSAFGLDAKFPGSTLPQILAKPVSLPEGGVDLYIRQDLFPANFAPDVPIERARQMAATQRPITQAAGEEKAAVAAWRALPSWFIYGAKDLAIPPELHAFMAERAHAKKALAVAGGSHVVMVSHPRDVADMIEAAAAQ